MHNTLEQQLEANNEEVIKIASKTSTKQKAKANETLTIDPSIDRQNLAKQAQENPQVLTALVQNLSTEARRMRQFCASVISMVAENAPDGLVAHIAKISDALYRPEAQTRWECLETLARVAPMDAAACDDAVIGAEGSLYDEESGNARLAAVRFLCAYGATSSERSVRVWLMLDEAIQCYHGDIEFQDMLVAVIGFAGGNIDSNVQESLVRRMEFDANNAKGALQKRAAQIIDLCNS